MLAEKSSIGGHYLVEKNNSDIYKIYPKSVKYIETYDHRTVIHTEDGDMISQKQLKEQFKVVLWAVRLAIQRNRKVLFLWPHRGISGNLYKHDFLPAGCSEAVPYGCKIRTCYKICTTGG